MKTKVLHKAPLFLKHIFAWLLVWFLMSLLASKGERLGEYLVKNISVMVPLVAVVYLNWFWLYPTFFAKKKYVLYGVLVLLSLYIVFFIGDIIIIEWMDLINPDRSKKANVRNVYQLPHSFWVILNGSAPYTLGLLASTVYLAIKQKQKDDKERDALRLESAQAKIKYLQSQISPHFLFNSLNNVHALIEQKSDLAAEYVIQLSDLLRFMIYETDKEYIALGDEIAVIKQYAALADFRIGKPKVSNALKIEIENLSLQLPPLLIVGILENGIKHSGMGLEEGVTFRMSIEEKKNFLEVQMTNSISGQKFDKEKKGIGLESIKKRLELYYPNQHRFSFKEQNRVAETLLIVKLKNQ